MLGRHKPIAFDPYGRRRSRWRMPRWLVLLLLGILIGAGGLLVAQEKYLPPRLSASASAELRTAYESAEATRTRLATELAAATKRLDTSLAEQRSLTAELGATRASAETLRGDLSAVVAAVPPDPRGGTVEVRAGRFATKGATLSYDLLLTRDRAGAKPLPGSLHLAVAGLSARGAPVTFTPPPTPLAIDAHEVVRGTVALPEGLKPNQVTVQVLDRVGGRALGMRVLLVK